MGWGFVERGRWSAEPLCNPLLSWCFLKKRLPNSLTDGPFSSTLKRKELFCLKGSGLGEPRTTKSLRDTYDLEKMKGVPHGTLQGH